MENKFMECDTCRAKPGSPTLCEGCLHNRAVIERLTPKEIVVDDKFTQFWKAYPNKKAKPVAMKKWKALKVDDALFEKIMNALAEHKKTPQWVKDNGQYIPHPSTWLNQQRWEDELKVEKSSENQSKFGHLS